MSWILIIVALGVTYFLYIGYKGNKDIKNVEKYGGLKIKYNTLIELIMARSSTTRLQQINSNNIRITSTGMMFKLIEIDKKIQITWDWHSFTTGKIHRLVWKFDENQDQNVMYETIKRDISIQNLLDDGLTKREAENYLKNINN
ncbi:Uncharacterised protein [Candidatus Ornithobacterium hominis]|uniref:Uncharacterized protein n=1 Tax=Candidatus Ornithobacterium hominis TaxID=2497989 RepID=A0A383U0Y9_9FLAO|nr:hypothetical protein [Candidatus Ornithobacterium hominis]MCT7905079.1 hypothetical protein [Candidatus Ornithobacterium hominis]SZD73504.1 Uncharacterised protein [Candidatus Ornithobacterium hominis]